MVRASAKQRGGDEHQDISWTIETDGQVRLVWRTLEDEEIEVLDPRIGVLHAAYKSLETKSLKALETEGGRCRRV